MLALLGRHLVSRVIKQLNEWIVIGVFKHWQTSTTCNSILAWPHPLLWMVMSLVVMWWMEEGLATQDQHNPYTLDRIVAM